MNFCVSVCVQVIFAGSLLGSTGQKPDPAALLEGYNLCNKEFETIACDLESESQSEWGRIVLTVRHCRNQDKVQWVGHRASFRAQVDPQSVVPQRVVNTYDGAQLAFLYYDFSPKFPNVPPAGQVFRRAGGLLTEIRQDWGESIEYGGPLVGKVSGSNNH